MYNCYTKPERTYIMSVVIGIDVGGSTTKIVGFTKDMALIEPMMVRATDPLTSIYGAFGKFTAVNHLELSDIEKVMVTGVGSSYIAAPIYGLECSVVPEFPSVGHGGLYLSGLDEAIVVSMGTGTAFIHAQKAGKIKHLGGTGVGGGTLMGLAKKLLDMEEVSNIIDLAEKGDLNKVDLRVLDITNKDTMPEIKGDLTASNFGKISDLTEKEDLALGIVNMICETVGMLALFAARSKGIDNVVLTGNLTTFPLIQRLFATLGDLIKMNYIIPANSQYGTVIGAALLSQSDEQ